MPSPREVFTNPIAHWEWLTASTDAVFEGQHFDRKEVGRPDTDGRITSVELKRLRQSEIAPAISAFANSNREGGLLVLGIAKDGTVHGLSHLNEEQQNALGNPYDIVIGHAAIVKFHPCTNDAAKPDHICLIFVPFSDRAICETHQHRAWERRGPQNVPLTPERLEALRRDKRITDYERLPVCGLVAEDIDEGVMREFRRCELADTSIQRSDQELLRTVGAIETDQSGRADLTTVGALFFLSNPQRVLPWATIRLVRYDVPVSERARRPLPTFDRELAGPISAQLRDFRAFVKDAGFFKTYQRRRPDGGFVDEPELPTIALDEAVVNAVVHRDYGIRIPILCEKYSDAFIVRSPGAIRQIHDLPSNFTLAEQQLESLPRNPSLMRLLKSMRDTQGRPYVQSLAEGTRRMQSEMAALELPAPAYEHGDGSTVLSLVSNAPAREAVMREQHPLVSQTAFANLFALVGAPIADRPHTASGAWRRQALEALRERLKADGWYADEIRKGKFTAHRRGDHVRAPAPVLSIVRLFPAFDFQVREYGGRPYLCLDYSVAVQPVLTLDKCARFGIEPTELVGVRCLVRWGNAWAEGRLIENAPVSTVHIFGPERAEQVANGNIIPRLRRSLLERAIGTVGVGYDLATEIKRVSLATQPKAARQRLDRTLKLARYVANTCFPLAVGSGTIGLDPNPAAIRRDLNASAPLSTDLLAEPTVEFHGRALENIREGITKFGSYDHEQREVELVPICAAAHRDRMAALIERLRNGKMRYLGAERTFSARMYYQTVVTAPSEDVTAEIQRLLEHHPEWRGEARLNRLFLIHTPESGYSRDDENAPYYRVKRRLLEEGIPSQMVDTPTLLNPDYKDLNLALNITAKVGIVPWVLPGSIPDADFFVGLSYTSSTRGTSERLMGFANVFNEYGRWEFYSGSGEAFHYEERHLWYERIVRDTLQALDNRLSETPRICFHYSAKFSRDDRAAILRAARSVRPNGVFTFVWINSHHPVRLYDARPEGDGSLARGSFVIGGPSQLYLSTTGFNPYRTALGTPQALEVNARVETPHGDAVVDLRALASQVLSLTKLNWASTDSLCAEPITTKYAGDIAYLTAAFLRQRGAPFRLHKVLERTPWFI